MKNSFLGEILISLILIALLILFLNPLQLAMPGSMHTAMVPLLIILFIIFSAILWKEAPGDERQQLHKFIASRFAYFAAISTLTLAIIVESLQRKLDPWIIIAICVLLLAKIMGLLFGNFKH